MNLTYPILWIDDQPESISFASDYIELILEDLGYIPEIKIATPLDDLDPLLKDDRWNLIAVDHDLMKDGTLTGKDLIQKIRENELFTEVIFYSGDPDKVRDSIQKEALEGVYWATRGEESELEDKVEKIILLTLRKVMDVNTMRGIVMAEVAEMDHEMEDIIRLHHNKIGDEEQAALREKILKKMRKSFKGNLNKVERLQKACTLDDCLDINLMDSSKRRRSVDNIFEKHKGLANEDQTGLLTSCKTLLTKRNLLAHGRTIIKDEEECVVSSAGSFVLQDAIDMRKELRDQRENFLELKTLLESYHNDN